MYPRQKSDDQFARVHSEPKGLKKPENKVISQRRDQQKNLFL